MAPSLLSPKTSNPNLAIYSSCRRLVIPCRIINISTFVRTPRAIVIQATAQSSNRRTNEGAKNKSSATVSNDLPSFPYLTSLPFPNVPIWPSWILGAAVLLAVPFYRRISKNQDKVEKTAEAAVEVVEKVAGATEKISSEVADALPENSKLKEVALEVEQAAEVAVKDADVTETLIKEVDDVVEKAETLAEPIIEAVLEGKEVNNQEK